MHAIQDQDVVKINKYLIHNCKASIKIAKKLK